jgi:DNA-binding winged helix-turn-helix (wHTH) protein
MTAVMKPTAAPLAQASVKPKPEFLFDNSLFSIASVDSKDIHWSRFLPVVVLIPRATAADQLGPHIISVTRDSSERSEATKPAAVLTKTAESLKTSPESVFTFGHVSVNFPAMEVFCKGEPVLLTTKEFETLRYFVQNARRVISRDELLNEVWGYENYPCTRTIDNHILRLRQKLERDPSRPVHFRTVHGAGYKFLPSASLGVRSLAEAASKSASVIRVKAAGR